MSAHHLALAFGYKMMGRPLGMMPDAATRAFDIFSAMDLGALTSGEHGGDAKPYEVVDGVATIAVHDQLVSRASWFSNLVGLTSYGQLRNALAAAAADRDVRGVILDFDSPGGDLAGSVETATAVRAFAAQKPIVSLVDSMAASAAYVVAAGANRVVVTSSATVGSIGLVYLHLDRSAALAKSGVKPTLLHKGRYKIDGHGYAALPDDARGRIEAMLSEAHNLILNCIDLHRPALGAAGARKTEGSVFMGQKAVAAGLADAVGGLETARAYLSSSRPSSPPPAASAAPQPLSSPGAKHMPTPANAPLAPEIAAIISAPYQVTQKAVFKALARAERREKANALVARQMGAKSIDDQWRDARARVSHESAPATSRDAPADVLKSTGAQTSDDMWRDIMKQQTRSSAFQ